MYCSGMGRKITTLRWFIHLERKKSEEFVKKVYVSEIEVPGGEEDQL